MPPEPADSPAAPIPGLGDFIAIRFRQRPSDWAGMVKRWRWPALGDRPAPIQHCELGDQVALAWQGDVRQQQSATEAWLVLEQAFGGARCSAGAPPDLAGYHGKYAAVSIERASGRLQAFTDPMRQIGLVAMATPQAVAVATDLRLLAQLPGCDLLVSAEAIYHYLNFGYIPTPFTIYQQVQKIPPGSRATLTTGGVTIERLWQPSYPEDLTADEPTLTRALTERIETAIGAFVSPGQGQACFLSGGTDSSTVASVLSKTAGPERIHAYSIGFFERAFDELDYAETAAQALGVHHHIRRIGAEDALGMIERLADSFDEPFGNSSAIPTFACAELAAADGQPALLAGDGGDEIFGGNERYAKNYYFDWYFRLPGPAKMLGRQLERALAPLDRRLTNKVANFLRRGALPNPERFYTDDSFASDVFEPLLQEPFRRQLDRRASLALLERHVADCDAHSELNQLMYIDLQMAIADNDLTKVNRSAKAAGVSVVYPYLAPDLIQFMGRVPAKWKVRGADKRYLFKRAVRELLPEAILKKKKHGFGLPVGHWFRTDPKISSLLGDTILAQRSVERGYFNRSFLADLIDRHRRGAWDFSNELWLLLMCELWHCRHVDAQAVGRHAA